MLSDQQMVTGIAVLAGGYSQLRCGLSSYHWQTVIFLAWFSSFTHLTTLTVLRGYLQENSAVRIWRIVFMLIIAILLGIALLPTGSGYWFDVLNDNMNIMGDLVAGLPVVCFFDELGTRRYRAAVDQTFSMAVSLAILTFGYTVRFMRLFSPSSRLARQYLRELPGDFWKQRIKPRPSQYYKSRISTIVERSRLELGLYVLIKAILDLLKSMLWEVRIL
jgi:hypothetical protein